MQYWVVASQSSLIGPLLAFGQATVVAAVLPSIAPPSPLGMSPSEASPSVLPPSAWTVPPSPEVLDELQAQGARARATKMNEGRMRRGSFWLTGFVRKRIRPVARPSVKKYTPRIRRTSLRSGPTRSPRPALARGLRVRRARGARGCPRALRARPLDHLSDERARRHRVPQRRQRARRRLPPRRPLSHPSRRWAHAKRLRPSE